MVSQEGSNGDLINHIDLPMKTQHLHAAALFCAVVAFAFPAWAQQAPQYQTEPIAVGGVNHQLRNISWQDLEQKLREYWGSRINVTVTQDGTSPRESQDRQHRHSRDANQS